MTIKRPANDYPPGEEPENSIGTISTPYKRRSSRAMNAFEQLPVDTQIICLLMALLESTQSKKIHIGANRIAKALHDSRGAFVKTSDRGAEITLEKKPGG